MGQMLGVDYSFSRPSPASIAGAGYHFAMRYLTGNGKAVTRAEIDALHAAGLAVGFVFESTAGRSAQGRAAGLADAKAALAAATALKVPATVPLFFAVDFDATVAQVSPYFQGVRSVLGGRAGVYGSYTITAAGLAPWRWQTMAWSHGKVDPNAHLIQQLRMTHPVPGCDENEVQHALPFWGPPAKPAPVAAKPAAAYPYLTPAQALAKIRRLAFRKVNIGVGACQRNAHEIYGIPTDGTPTAAAAWAKAKHRHLMSVEPPRGAFVYWTGGRSGAGHVAIYAGRGIINRHRRYVWSPGAPNSLGPGSDGRWVKCRLVDIETGWPGHTLVGWTEDIDGVHVPGLEPGRR